MKKWLLLLWRTCPKCSFPHCSRRPSLRNYCEAHGSHLALPPSLSWPLDGQLPYRYFSGCVRWRALAEWPEVSAYWSEPVLVWKARLVVFIQKECKAGRLRHGIKAYYTLHIQTSNFPSCLIHRRHRLKEFNSLDVIHDFLNYQSAPEEWALWRQCSLII